MARKVTVGPKVKQGSSVAVNVAFDDVASPGGSTVHVKVILPIVDGEGEDGHVNRAAITAKRIVDRMSEEIGNGVYSKRHGFTRPEEDEGVGG